MATLTELETRRDRLLARLESLQQRVSHGDKSISFDLERAEVALARLDREIARTGNRRIVRHLRVRSLKDL